MNGSDKQIKWAEAIKAKFEKSLDEVIKMIPETNKDWADKMVGHIKEDLATYKHAEDFIVRRDGRLKGDLETTKELIVAYSKGSKVLIAYKPNQSN